MASLSRLLGMLALIITCYILNLNFLFLKEVIPKLRPPIHEAFSLKGQGIEHLTLNGVPALHLLVPGGLAVLAIITGLIGRALSLKRVRENGKGRSGFGRALGYLSLLALTALVLLHGAMM